MGLKLYPEENIQAIADAIRDKNGESTEYTTAEMADAILDIPSGLVFGDLAINAVGTYDVSEKSTATYIYPMPFRAYINATGNYWAYYNDSSTSFCFSVKPGTMYTLTWDSETSWSLYRVAFTKTTTGPSTNSTSTSYRRTVYNISGTAGLELNGFQRSMSFTVPANSALKLCVIQIAGTNDLWNTGTIFSWFEEVMTHLTIEADPVAVVFPGGGITQ